MRPAIVAAAVFVVALLSWGEWAHWRASGRRLGHPAGVPGSEAVVVLGFRNRGTRANYLNRYRVRAGLRSIDAAATESVVVFCGGSVGGATAEAELMARYARDRCGYRGPMNLDTVSRTTRQNVENAIALVEGADVVKIVSNSLHAEKARAYLWIRRPDLAARLARGRDYRFGEITLVKPVAAFFGLRALREVGPAGLRGGRGLRFRAR